MVKQLIPTTIISFIIFAGLNCNEDESQSPIADETSEMIRDSEYELYGEVEQVLDANFDTFPDIINEMPEDSPPDEISIPWPDGKYITIHEVRARLELGDTEMLLLNVSDEEFYYLGHIPGSVVIPWDLLSEHLDLVDPSFHIVIYCRRGVRSESAYTTLQDASYPYIWIMEGGLEAWIAAGYPTVSCDDPSVRCL